MSNLNTDILALLANKPATVADLKLQLRVSKRVIVDSLEMMVARGLIVCLEVSGHFDLTAKGEVEHHHWASGY